MLMRHEWIKRFRDHMRPHVNDAPTLEELEEFLQREAELAYDNLDAFAPETTPEDAALECIDAIRYYS